jgi:hypothetical protein
MFPLPLGKLDSCCPVLGIPDQLNLCLELGDFGDFVSVAPVGLNG